MEGLSVLDMIQQGALVTYPLIVMSIVVITIIGERLWALRGLIAGTLQTAQVCSRQIAKRGFQNGPGDRPTREELTCRADVSRCDFPARRRIA